MRSRRRLACSILAAALLGVALVRTVTAEDDAQPTRRHDPKAIAVLDRLLELSPTPSAVGVSDLRAHVAMSGGPRAPLIVRMGWLSGKSPGVIVGGHTGTLAPEAATDVARKLKIRIVLPLLARSIWDASIRDEFTSISSRRDGDETVIRFVGEAEGTTPDMEMELRCGDDGLPTQVQFLGALASSPLAGPFRLSFGERGDGFALRRLELVGDVALAVGIDYFDQPSDLAVPRRIVWHFPSGSRDEFVVHDVTLDGELVSGTSLPEALAGRARRVDAAAQALLDGWDDALDSLHGAGTRLATSIVEVETDDPTVLTRISWSRAGVVACVPVDPSDPAAARDPDYAAGMRTSLIRVLDHVLRPPSAELATFDLVAPITKSDGDARIIEGSALEGSPGGRVRVRFDARGLPVELAQEFDGGGSATTTHRYEQRGKRFVLAETTVTAESGGLHDVYTYWDVEDGPALLKSLVRTIRSEDGEVVFRRSHAQWELDGRRVPGTGGDVAPDQPPAKPPDVDPEVEDARRWVSEANAQLDAGETAEAIATLHRAIERHPNVVRLWTALARAYYIQDDFAKSEEASRRAVEVDAQDASAWWRLGVMLTHRDRHEEALDAYDAVLELKPRHFLANYNKGWTLELLDRYEEALTVLLLAVELRPDHEGAVYNAGLALRGLERYAEALEWFERADRLNPDDGNVHWNLGLMLEELGRYEEALAKFRRGDEISGSWSARARRMGVCLYKLGRKEEALSEFDRAIRADPTSFDSRYWMGRCLRSLGRMDEAIDALRAANERSKTRSDAWAELGMAYDGLKRYDAAVSAYREALRRRPANSVTRSNLGLALWKFKRFDEAVVEFERVLAEHPEDRSANLHLGRVHRDAKRFEEALAAHDELVKHRPDWGSAWREYGVSLHFAKRAAEAVAALERAAEMLPDDADVWHWLGNARRDVESDDAAVHAFETALRLRPRAHRTLYSLGWVQRRRGDFPAAVRAYRVAVEVRPNDAWSLWGLAASLAQSGEDDEPDQILSQLRELDPEVATDLEELLTKTRAERETDEPRER